jgi:release factor glutamine methyltransferase
VADSDVRERLVGELRAAGCVFAEDEADMVLDSLRDHQPSAPGADADAVVRDYVDRRRLGEPAEYILGWATLGGVRVRVGPGVFIPRRWTERLVERAVALLSDTSDGVVVDLGTGSGAIALAIHAGAQGSRVWATEVAPAALEWARRNCAGVAGLTVCEGDLYGGLPPALAGDVDLVVGSLPYVPGGELDKLPRDHLVTEPPVAFDGGVDGLAMVTRAVAGAPRWLRPAGAVLLEIGIGHGPAAEEIATQAGFRHCKVHRDDDHGELFLEASLAET